MTASYTAQVDAFGRQVQWLVEIDLDRCSRTYTTSPCTATDAGDGLRCYYSYSTCQDQANYAKETRTYRFCLNHVPWPDNATPCFPFLEEFTVIPQKVDSDRLLVFPESVDLRMVCDANPLAPDVDRGAGYYNTTTAGEFWRNLVARNTNYVGRALRIKRGFNVAGFALADFEQVGPTFKIRQIQFDRDRVTVTAESGLADLSKISVPWTTSDNNVLQATVTGSATSFTVRDGSEFPDPADYTRNTIYVSVESEICQVSSISSNTLTVVRGALGTEAVAHVAGKRVQNVASFGTPAAPQAPTDMILDVLEWAKVPSADIDTASFTAVKDNYWQSADMHAVIRRPKKASELMARIREPRGILVYLNKAGKWACVYMGPATAAGALTDDHLIYGKTSLNHDDQERLTRVSFWWDPVTESTSSQMLADSYERGAIFIDASLENPLNYNDQRGDVFVDAYLWSQVPSSRVANIARRIVTRRRAGVWSISFQLDIKDATYGIGEMVTITTDQRLGTNGLAASVPYLITARKEVSEAVVEYHGIDMGSAAVGRYARIGPDTIAATYGTASDSDKGYAYWGDSSTNQVGSPAVDGYLLV